MNRSAVISKCGTYRYSLSRDWGYGNRALFVMLNPSTADGKKDDPTIRRLIGFCKKWGYIGFDVVNLFAYRTNSPSVLLNMYKQEGLSFIRGRKNDTTIENLACDVDTVICAWGKSGGPIARRESIRLLTEGGLLESETENKLHYLDLTIDGVPKHPLYLSYDLTPKLWKRENQ